MRFLNRLRYRYRRAPSTTSYQVRAAPGPLTAHEAWALVRPVAQALDRGARLTLLTSGLDINPEGRAFAWSFGFELPRRRWFALLSLGPSGEGADIDDDPVVLTEHLRRLTSGEPARPTLPVPFVDSPAAVAQLAAQGVDFVSGPTDMKLEARMLPTGVAVWVTEGWEGERMVGFGA